MNKKCIFLVLFCLPTVLTVLAQGRIVFSAPLTSTDTEYAGARITSDDGMFSSAGWKSTGKKGLLKIELPGEGVMSGVLAVKISGIDWVASSAAAGVDKKIHFLNMFSNPSGDHHAENGGTAEDALWTLRAGTDSIGNSRYKNTFKVLWSSKGAKRTDGNLYSEKRAKAPGGWNWDPSRKYEFRVSWGNGALKVLVDGVLFFEGEWRDQRRPLKYVFIGKGGDFTSWPGPVFSELVITDTGSSADTAVKGPGSGKKLKKQ